MDRKLGGLILVVAMLAGCATGYQSKGVMGGFSETALAPDTYRVTFTGNGYTDMGRAQDFVLLRAADLTLANGFRYFEIDGSDDESTTATAYVPKTSYTTGTATVTGYGNTAQVSGQATTTSYGGYSIPVFRPGVAILVRMHHDQPADRRTFSADYVQANIRAKYKIKP
jgi:hypothetical protein